MRGAGNWAGARNLLCIRLDALGDVLMTEPAIRALRGSLARSRITLLTSTSGAEACGMIAAIDDVIAYDPPWMRSGSGQRRREDRGMIDRLARHRFDGAVIFTVYSQSALPAAYLTHLAGIPRSLAYGRENPYHLLTDHRAEDEPHRIVRHEVRRHLDLVASIGCSTPDERIHVRPSPRARRSIRERIGAMGLRRDEPWVVVHAGATAPSRRYPVERFAEVVARLRRDLRWPVVLTGSEAERDLVEAVRRTAGVPVHSLAGELSVPELAALIERASILLSNNTAPVHLAAGVGTPVVVLYALTNPQHTPWGVPSRVLIHDVPCRFCYRSVCPQGHHRCLRGIEPVTVVDALHELWRSTRGELRGTDRPVAGRVVPIDTPPVRLPVPATLG